jgi:hypothetical protein
MIVQARKYLPEYFESDLDRLKVKGREVVYPLIEALVEHAAFREMNTKGMEERMQKLVDENPFVRFAYAVDQHGRQLTQNVTQLADKAKYSRFGIGEDFSDRMWFLGPMKDGQTHITDFYKSVITDALCVTVSTPVRNLKEEIVGICGLDLKFEDLIKIDRKVETVADDAEKGNRGVMGEIL